MPFKYDDKRKKFTTMGIFCSWPCMKAYNIDRAGPRYGEYQQMITLMRRDVYNILGGLMPAPKRQCLKVFGGTMTIEEFRGCKDPPMLQLPNEAYMVCRTATTVTSSETPTMSVQDSVSKMSSIQTATGQNEQLKLKRTKPLKRMESPLEKSLGIKRKTPGSTFA